MREARGRWLSLFALLSVWGGLGLLGLTGLACLAMGVGHGRINGIDDSDLKRAFWLSLVLVGWPIARALFRRKDDGKE